MASHRETTRRRTARWQIAALALAGATAAVVALPMDRLLASSDTPDETVGFDPIAPPDIAPTIVDVARPSEIMRDLGGDRKPPTDITTTTTTTGDGGNTGTGPSTTTAQTTERSKWTYLGSIVGPRSKNALVKIDDKQHIVPEGGEVGGVKLIAVGADHIKIQEGEAEEEQIQITKPAGLVTGASTPPHPVTPAGGANVPLDARRAAMGRNAPQPPNNLNPQQMQLLKKALGNPAVSERERMRVLEQVGFSPDMPPLDRARRHKEFDTPASADPFVARAMQQYGIDPASDNNDIIQRLEEVYGQTPDGGF